MGPPAESANSNRSTRGNPASQLPSPASSRLRQTLRVRVLYPGELAGSGNTFFHDFRRPPDEKRTSAKRCFRVRGTHDLETRQHCFSVWGWFRRKPTVWSSVSGGRRGVDIVARAKVGMLPAFTSINRCDAFVCQIGPLLVSKSFSLAT